MGHISLPLPPSGVARTERSIVSCVGGSRSKRLREGGETSAFGQLPATRVKGKKMRGAAGGGQGGPQEQQQRRGCGSQALLPVVGQMDGQHVVDGHRSKDLLVDIVGG